MTDDIKEIKPPAERIVPEPTARAPEVAVPKHLEKVQATPVKPAGPPAHERITPEPESVINAQPRSIPLDRSHGVAIRRNLVPVLCVKCGAKTQKTQSSRPFNEGPYKGGFLCQDCIILDWSDQPGIAADVATRKWLEEESRRIRLQRAGEGAKLVYDDGANRAYLTRRGTVVVDLARAPFGAPDEYDADRFQALMRL